MISHTKAFYLGTVLLLAGAVNYTVYVFWNAIKDTTIEVQFRYIWEILILGFVVGGVILQLPKENLKPYQKKLIELSGALAVFGSIVSLMSFGFAADPTLLGYGKVVSTIAQGLARIGAHVGITAMFLGVAVSGIETCRIIWQLVVNLIRDKG